jgi:predicted MFS family arabinose efflux permease
LSNARFTTGVAVNIFQSLVISGLLFVLPLFLQSGLGFSAFQSGLAILPFSIATFVVAMGTSRLGKKIEKKWLIQIGILLLAAGIILLRFIISINLTIVQMIIPMAVFGIGMGLLMAHLINAIMTAVSTNDSSEASGVNNSMDQLGNSIGTAVIGSMLTAFFFGNIVTGIFRTAKVELPQEQRQQIVTQLEDFTQVASADQKKEFIQSLPQSVQNNFENILNSSITEAMQ